MSGEAIGTRMKSSLAQVWLALSIVLTTIGLLLECLTRWLVSRYHTLRRLSPASDAAATDLIDTELRLQDCDLLRQMLAEEQPLIGSGYTQGERK